jgi:hypothetical protein
MDPIEWILTVVQKAMYDVATTMWNFLAPLVSEITRSLADYAQTMYTWMGNLFSKLWEWMQAGWQTLMQWVDTAITAMQTYMQRFISALYDLTEEVMDSIRRLLSDAIAQITSFVESVIEWVQDLFTSIIDGVRAIVEEVTSDINYVFRKLAEFINDVTDGILSGVSDAMRELDDFLKALFEETFTAIDGVLSNLAAQFNDLGEAFSNAAKKIVEGMSDVLGDNIKDLGQLIEKAAGAIFGFSNVQEVNEFVEAVDDIASPHTLAAVDREAAFAMWQKLLPRNAVARGLYALVFSLGVGYNVYGGISSACGQLILRQWARQYSYKSLDAPDAVASWRKGDMSLPDLVDNLAGHGYSSEDAERLKNLSQGPPAAGELLTLHRRGALSDGDLSLGLRQGGLADEWQTKYMQLAELIPGVQDIITMAVREAFTPDIAKTFGQYEDFPEELAYWCDKQGLSREWAERYWAAHWALPSASQGFEMLQRGVIDQQTLNLLLRALDVMPFWRDKLTDICYHPLTRIDVRRMYAMDVINEEQVTNAYEDLGYNEVNAQLLTEFVKRASTPKEKASVGEVETLSRTTILSYFRTGVLPAEKALELLRATRLSDEAARLYLAGTEHEIEHASRKASIAHVLEMAQVGAIDWQEAQHQLSALNLTAVEIDRAMLDLAKLEAKTVKLPSRSEGEEFFREGIIDEARYRALLSRLGYAAQWIDAFVVHAERKRGKP